MKIQQFYAISIGAAILISFLSVFSVNANATTFQDVVDRNAEVVAAVDANDWTTLKTFYADDAAMYPMAAMPIDLRYLANVPIISSNLIVAFFKTAKLVGFSNFSVTPQHVYDHGNRVTDCGYMSADFTWYKPFHGWKTEHIQQNYDVRWNKDTNGNLYQIEYDRVFFGSDSC
jgi:hypothetical protein